MSGLHYLPSEDRQRIERVMQRLFTEERLSGDEMRDLAQTLESALRGLMHAEPTIVVTKCTETCGGCPSQWEGLTADGREFYVRYRWGHLYMGVAKNLTDAIRGTGTAEIVIDEQVGDGMDGFMSGDELVKHTKGKVVWETKP